MSDQVKAMLEAFRAKLLSDIAHVEALLGITPVPKSEFSTDSGSNGPAPG